MMKRFIFITFAALTLLCHGGHIIVILTLFSCYIKFREHGKQNKYIGQ